MAEAEQAIDARRRSMVIENSSGEEARLSHGAARRRALDGPGSQARRLARTGPNTGGRGEYARPRADCGDRRQAMDEIVAYPQKAMRRPERRFRRCSRRVMLTAAGPS